MPTRRLWSPRCEAILSWWEIKLQKIGTHFCNARSSTTMESRDSRNLKGPTMPIADKFHDECGVVAIFAHSEAEKLAYLGLHALQHRGQESAGIVTSDGLTARAHKAMGSVADIFTEEVLSKLRGSIAIGHTRYSTAGDSALLNAQPILV